jgi:hypothetical protein
MTYKGEAYCMSYMPQGEGEHIRREVEGGGRVDLHTIICYTIGTMKREEQLMKLIDLENAITFARKNGAADNTLITSYTDGNLNNICNNIKLMNCGDYGQISLDLDMYECRTCGGVGYTSDWPEEIRPDSTIGICHRCQTNELNEECDG